jgi:tetratricopeptide (TPR) repeat protein
MRISEIRNSQQFQDLCQQILAAEFSDFQVLDDSSGDKGIDGYIPSNRRLFAMYCPEKSPVRKLYYQKKIREDLAKAVALRDKHGYAIDEWIFLTPAPLNEELQRYLATKVKQAGFATATNWSEKHLLPILLKHKELESLFPDLFSLDIKRELRGGFSDIASSQVEIKSSLNLIAAQLDNDRRFDERIRGLYEKRFDTAKDKFYQGLFVQARDAFTEILNDLKSDSDIKDPALIARAYTNIGTCEWHLGSDVRAADAYAEAHVYNPKDSKCIANFASAHMLRGQTAKALEVVNELLADHPNDKLGVTTKANVLLSDGKYDEAIMLLKEHGQDELSDYFEALKNVSHNDYKAAEQIFRRLVEQEPANTNYLVHLAANILIICRDTMAWQNNVASRTTPELRQALAEAEGILSRVIDLLNSKESKHRLVGAHINRSFARIMLGEQKGAIEDCEDALRAAPDTKDAYLNKSKAEIEIGGYFDALQDLQRYIELGGSTDFVIRDLAFCYFRTGQISNAKDLLHRYLARELVSDDLNLAGLAVHVYDLAQEPELADRLIDRLEKSFPDHPGTFSVRARHFEDTGQEGAEELLRRSLELARGSKYEETAALNLADYLFQYNRFIDALPLYEPLTGEEFTSTEYRFLVCLYYAGRYEEVLQHSARYRGDRDIDGSISPIEAAAFKSLDRLREAADIFLALFQKETAIIDFLVEYGICLFRLGEETKALTAFDQARKKITKPRDLMALADGYSKVGQARIGIELGYEALQQQPNNPEVHRLYIALFFNLKYHPEVIGTKYAKAFEDSRDNFNKRFPDAKGFQLVNIVENPTFIQDQLRESMPSTAEIIDGYRQNQLPITSKAFLAGKDTFDSWAALIASPELGFKGSLASTQEQQLEMEIIATSQEVVAELLALFTLARINKLELLDQCFNRVYVHQATLDELSETLVEERRHVEEGRKYLSLQGGQLVKFEISADEVKKDVQLLEDVLHFVKEKCHVTGLLRQVANGDQLLLDNFSEASAYSAICASQRKLPLLSDDGLLRLPLRNNYQVTGFSTLTLLRHAHAGGKLTEEELHDSVLALLGLQYRYVAVNDKLLTYSFARSGYSAGKEFDLVLEELGRREVSIDHIVVSAGNFLKRLWITPTIPPAIKSLTLHRLLAAMTIQHPARMTLRKLLGYLEIEMNLVIQMYEDIRRQTNQWFTIARSKREESS